MISFGVKMECIWLWNSVKKLLRVNGQGLRLHVTFNKAMLEKWLWRFTKDKTVCLGGSKSQV